MAKSIYEIDCSDFGNVKKAMNEIPEVSRKAMAYSLNRTADKTVEYTHNAVNDRYAVKKIGVKKTISIKKAKPFDLEAVVTSTDRRLKISHFPYKSVGKKRIAKVQIRNGAYVQSTANPPLFVGKANKTTGKREVFQRTTSGPYKVKFGITLAIPQMIQNEKVWEHIALKSNYFLQERLEHDFDFYLDKTFRKYSNRG